MPLFALKSFLNVRPTVKERLALGKQIRRQVPRSALGEFKPRIGRKSFIHILKTQAESRIQELIPIRHARMAVNQFAFYRGGAAVMAHDLASLPTAPIMVQLCGDMHVSNFGFFSTTEHHLVFGINDLDETLPGNFDWDLKRLAASAVVAAQHLGQDKKFGEYLIREMVTSYREHLFKYAHVPYIDLVRTYIDEKTILDAAEHVSKDAYRFVKNATHKAKQNNNEGALHKLTHATPMGRRITDNPPLITHLDVSLSGQKVSDFLDEALKSYAQSLLTDRRQVLCRYRVADWARKVVGVGSVGTACWVIYLEGLNSKDPLFLQFKEAKPSVLAPYFPSNNFETQGQRVAQGQRLIQGAPDLFLGYGTTSEREFYGRQLRDMKGGIAIGNDGINVKTFPYYARLFGWALANAHARSGDPALLAGYCGKTEQLDDALVKFGLSYSTQNESDYEQFCKAIKSGKLPCATDNY